MAWFIIYLYCKCRAKLLTQKWYRWAVHGRQYRCIMFCIWDAMTVFVCVCLFNLMRWCAYIDKCICFYSSDSSLIIQSVRLNSMLLQPLLQLWLLLAIVYFIASSSIFNRDCRTSFRIAFGSSTTCSFGKQISCVIIPYSTWYSYA